MVWSLTAVLLLSVAVVTPATAVADPGLSVSGLEPSAGSVSGGTVVSISGTGFDPGSDVVTVGGVEATIANDSTDQLLQVTTPPSPGLAVGSAVIEVVAIGGALASDVFTYKPDIDPTADRADHVVLGELASRSKKQPVTRTTAAPYLTFGTDARTGESFVYESDYNYAAEFPPHCNTNTAACREAYTRASDERPLRGISSDPRVFEITRTDVGDLSGSNPEGPGLPQVHAVDARDDILFMKSYSICQTDNVTAGVLTFCSVFGPEVFTEPFYATADQALAFDWAAVRANDDYAVYAFLVAVDDPTDSIATIRNDVDAHTLILHQVGFNQNWTTTTGDIPVDGFYRFRFVNGSFDGSGGHHQGAHMYVDDVVLVGAQNAIDLAPIGDQVGTGASVHVEVSATSGQPVTVTSATADTCTVSVADGIATIETLALGTCTLRASQGTTGEFAPAATVSRTFRILSAVSAPAAPTLSNAASGRGSLQVTFAAGSDGGAAVTGYEYSLDGGDWTAFSPPVATSPATITGLDQRSYGVRLRAVNSEGPGAVSNTVSGTPGAPPTAPAPPSVSAVTPGPGSLEVSFTPGSDGGAAVTGYEYSLDGGDWTAFSPPVATSPATITGLDQQPYEVRLRAVNIAGPGTASDPVTATPDPRPRIAAPRPPGPAPTPPSEGGTGTVGGQPVQLTVESGPSRARMVGDGFEVEVDTGRDDAPPQDSEGSDEPSVVLDLRRGEPATVTAAGLRSNSAVQVWLWSQPRLLGTFETSASGTLDTSSVPIPDDVEACAHRLQIIGTVPSGDDLELALDVRVTADPSPFDDLPFGATHADAAACLADLGIVQGTGPGTFDPRSATTRGQVAAMLARTLHLDVDAVQAGQPFPDVPGTTHQAAIAAAHTAGLVDGFDDGTFRPGLPVTRGQWASMLTRALGDDGLTPARGSSPFTDTTGTTHAPAIAQLHAHEITHGYTDRTYRPHSPITRAEIATTLDRALPQLQSARGERSSYRSPHLVSPE